jgi:hypothetical protein
MRAWMLTLAAAAAIGVIAPGAARAAADLKLTDIADPASFTMPVDVISPPQDPSRVFVVQQGGKVLMVKDGVVSTFLDLRGRVNQFGEEGLMSIAFAPDFAHSGLLYAFYSDASACTGSSCDDQLDEFHATPDLADSSARRPVITIPHQAASGHHGGTLRFGADGLLYISTGDAQTPENAENTTLLNGKILRIDPRAHGSDPYTVPSDNPFVGDPPAQPEIWASGLRNPWRFSFDEYTGDLVVPDVGEHTREEINLVPGGNAAGKDFEWSTCEGEFAFPPTAPPTPCPLSGTSYVSPVLTYGHDEFSQTGDGCGPGGGSVIGGVEVRDLRLPTSYLGRYMYGDYCHQYVWTADLEAGSLAAVHDTIQDTGFVVGSGVTSIDRDADCRIYITHSSGWVRRVDPVGAPAGPVGCATPPPPPPPPPSDGGGPGGSQPETTPAPSPGNVAVVDRTRPVLGRAGMVRTRFAVAEGPTAISAVARGTAFRFLLSKAGVVTIRVARARLGRRAGRLCLAAARARRRLPGCTRLTATGALTRRLAAGGRSVPFSGRIGSRPLGPGRYRATLTARDTAGNVSRSQTLSFTIVAG